MSSNNILPILFLLLATASSSVVGSSSVPLTQDNFDEKTKGKVVFAMFMAPWCGHCKELKPKWEQMAQEWENHDSVLVASVDCTQEEEWCVSLGIQGFPTLLYGDPSEKGVFLEPYSGEKEYEALSEFAKETFDKPICSVANPTACDEASRTKILDLWNLSDEALELAISEQQQFIEEAETKFRDEFSTMQADYDQKEIENEFQLAKMRSRIKLLKRLLSKQ